MTNIAIPARDRQRDGRRVPVVSSVKVTHADDKPFARVTIALRVPGQPPQPFSAAITCRN